MTMSDEVTLNQVYGISKDMVVREISGEVLIIPLTSGLGNMEDEIFSLNETGKAILQKMDGVRSLQQIASELSQDYEAQISEIQTDVIGITREMKKRKMLSLIS